MSKYTLGFAKRALDPEKALVATLVAERDAVNAVAGARSVAASMAIFILVLYCWEGCVVMVDWPTKS